MKKEVEHCRMAHERCALWHAALAMVHATLSATRIRGVTHLRQATEPAVSQDLRWAGTIGQMS